jgi:predicted alpha/beta superfamily hydrolase
MIISHPDFPSNHVPARQVDVWLPPEYGVGNGRRYPVLYMHDGQNLFDPAVAYAGVTWGVPKALTRLIEAGEAPPTIIVGIWNAGEGRWTEYMPQRPFTAPVQLNASDQQKISGIPTSDAYLRFLVTELKPFIDQTYATRPEREATFVMGSSMGGLISLYALCEYPDVFAGAGCVSTHWSAGDGIVIDYMAAHLPPHGRHRLYFDYGTETLDATYEPYQQRADAVLAAAGYTPGQDWITRKFEGAEHSERSWQERVHIPLAFLLKEVASGK